MVISILINANYCPQFRYLDSTKVKFLGDSVYFWSPRLYVAQHSDHAFSSNTVPVYGQLVIISMNLELLELDFLKWERSFEWHPRQFDNQF